MANVARCLLQLMLVMVAASALIAAWQLPDARLPILSWLLWTVLSWRPSVEAHR